MKHFLFFAKKITALSILIALSLNVLTSNQSIHSNLVRNVSAQEAGDEQPLSEFVTKGVDADTLEALNPLTLGSPVTGDRAIAGEVNTVGDIINRILVFALALSGSILMVMIVWGGFDMLSGAATKKSIDDGKKRITAAIVGFILLFSSYWLIQIIETIFGVNILGI